MELSGLEYQTVGELWNISLEIQMRKRVARTAFISSSEIAKLSLRVVRDYSIKNYPCEVSGFISSTAPRA